MTTTDPNLPLDGGDPTAGGPAAPDGSPPTTTPESQIQSALERALARTVAPAFQALRHEVGELRGAAKGGAAPAPAGTTAPAPDDYTALAADPRAFVRKVAMEDVASQMGPSVLQLIANAQEATIREEARTIDETFGTGFFDKEIREKLDDALKQVAPERRAEPGLINATVSAVLGMAYRDPAKLAELTSRRTAAETARRAPPMLGPGRTPPRGDKSRPSPEEAEFVARLSRAGVDISINEYVRDRDTPGTLSAWQARLDAEKTAKPSPTGGQ